MGKVLGSWSGMRKYLEQEMLAESLKGRVRYGCTTYPGMDGCHIFEICLDGKQFKRFSWETVNTYFIKQGYKDNKSPEETAGYWDGFWSMLAQYPISSRTEYTDEEFCDALAIYRNQDIGISISSPHPLVKMFALLDRRVGKRTMDKLQEQIAEWPIWLRELYEWRKQVSK